MEADHSFDVCSNHLFALLTESYYKKSCFVLIFFFLPQCFFFCALYYSALYYSYTVQTLQKSWFRTFKEISEVTLWIVKSSQVFSKFAWLLQKLLPNDLAWMAHISILSWSSPDWRHFQRSWAGLGNRNEHFNYLFKGVFLYTPLGVANCLCLKNIDSPKFYTVL